MSVANYLKSGCNRQDNRYKVMFLLLGILAVLPQLWIKYPSLIDDGSDFIQVAKSGYWQVFWSSLVNDERLRPVSWILKKVLFEIIGLNMWGYYLLGGVMLGLVCYLLFNIYREIGINKYGLLLAPLFVLILPSTYANYYRLGTNEPLQLLLLLCIYYFWLRKRYWAAWIFLVLCLFTKETSLFLVVIFIWLSLNNKDKVLGLASLMSWAACFVLLSFRLLRPNLTYISQVRLTLDYFWLYVWSSRFSLVLDLFALLGMVYILYNKRFKDVRINILVFLWVCSMIPIFIWDIASQEYYLLVHQVMAVSVVVVALDWVIKYKDVFRNIWIKSILLTGVWSLFLVVFVKYDLPVASYWHQRAITDGSLSGFLLTRNLEKISVYSGVLDYETLHKVFLYSNAWKEKYSNGFYPNIKEWVNHDFDDLDYFENQTEQTRQDFVNSENEYKIYIIDRTDIEFEKKYERILICGQTPFMKKKCGYMIYCENKTRSLLNVE